MPTDDLPNYLRFIHPPVNTKYYSCYRNGSQSILKDGGVFSPDGVHPTAIGQEIVAYEFLKVMAKAGVHANGVAVSQSSLDWANIVESDSLYKKPLVLVNELYQHNELMNVIKRLGQLF